MSRHGRPFSFRTTIARIATAMLAAWYVVIVLGVPIPMPRPAITGRFPCENCHCGCSTAEQCWSNCCCHTVEERLAWAEREGVEPPAFVSELVARQKSAPACCVAKHASKRPARCCSSVKASLKTCCTPPTNAETQRHEEGTKRKGDYLVGWRALACQGTGIEWTTATPAIAVTVIDVPSFPAHIEWLRLPPAPLHETPFERPPVPPPRPAAV